MKFDQLEKLEKQERRQLAKVLFVAAFVLGGCQYAAPQVGSAVETYCTATDREDQAALRQRFDAETDPHKIRIKCGEETGKTEGET